MNNDKLENTIRQHFDESGGRDALAQDILSLSAEVNAEDHSVFGVDEPFIDCRLQYHDTGFAFRTGDSSYDQDHRGSWGCSSVVADMSIEDAQSIADELIDQVIEDAYMSDD